MADLIVVAYDDQHKAEEMRLKLLKLQSEYLLELEDAVVAVKKPDGKIKLHQAVNLPAMGALQGGFWGTLIGCLFFMPLFGMAAGAASGAISGALSDVGINDEFMKQVSEKLTPGSSALFVLLRKVTADKVLEALEGTGGTVIQTSLSHEKEEKLQEALSAAKLEYSKAPTA
jgi:uncharacterized membrane protein